MKRRDFLRLVAVAAALPLIPIGITGIRPVEAAVDGVVYRADSQGRIFTSRDAGSTWQFHSYFGSQLSILALSVDGEKRVRAQVGFRGHSFGLVLAPGGKFWNTLG